MCWGGLRNIPPKDFPTVGEIESTGRILKVLKDAIPEFVKVVDKGEEIGNKMTVTEKEEDKMALQKERQDFIRESSKVEEDFGREVIDVAFENDDFNVFFQQFERWGKNWFFKIEQFIDFRKEMCATNSQPKKAT